MKFVVAADTDIGAKKETNQDCVCIKTACSKGNFALMSLLCDGMGGLECGELASATVLFYFVRWFDNELSRHMEAPDWERVADEWRNLLVKVNDGIVTYGNQHSVKLGTTFSGILIIGTRYMIAHVGDSRIYFADGDHLTQLTEDHSLVAREVAAGRLSTQQAVTDPRRSVLLRCIGEQQQPEIDFSFGEVLCPGTFLLCSDGLVHENTEEELFDACSPTHLDGEATMKGNIRHLIDTAIGRGEKDNISAALIRCE